jgi:uncharacterized protein (TIGR02246 family)
MNELEKPILQVLDSYKAAVKTKDVDAFVALYDQDVCIFDMWGEWSYKGIEAWRRMVIDWFGSLLGAERVIVDFNGVQTILGNDIAIAHAFVVYKSVSADGDELRSMQNRLTWALKHKDGIWKIIHEHTSAPVNFETSKVILQA